MLNLDSSLDVNVDYSVAFLISQLEINKAKHIEEYKQALVVYEQDRLSLLKEIQKEAKVLTTVDTKDNRDRLYRLNHSFYNLKLPVNAEKTYDTYIGLLKNTVSENVNLGISDANAIINDEWDWAVSAKTTNYSYSSRYSGR